MPKPAEVAIDPSIVDVLRASTIEGRVLKLPQLKRSEYLRVADVLDGMGGKWNRRHGGIAFDFDPGGVIQAAIATGRYVDRKKTLQFFETPEDLAERMADLAGIRTGMRVLEPSAGHGRLCRAALDRGAVVAAIEIDPLNVAVLDAIRGGGHRLGTGLRIWHADFLQWCKGTQQRFDAVLMNPPFTGGQDIAHVMAAWPLLLPGATLVAIVSEHAFIGQEWQAREFRRFVAQLDQGRVERLEAGTFRSSGTNARARLISGVRT